MEHSTQRPALWVPGDWNAFFGFGTNILVNMLTLTALLRFVLKMPDELVFGRQRKCGGRDADGAIMQLTGVARPDHAQRLRFTNKLCADRKES